MTYRVSFKVLNHKAHISLEDIEETERVAEYLSSALQNPVKIKQRVDADNRYKVIEIYSNGEKKPNLKGANL